MIPDPKGEWKKSSYSSGQNGNCVEMCVDQDMVGVRDSKNPDQALVFPAANMTLFVRKGR